jgi:PAS domain S-box-containing protein
LSLKLSLGQKALILVVVPLAFELGFVIELQSLLHEVEAQNQREVHTRTVASHLSNLLRYLMSSSLNSAVTSFSRSMGSDSSLLVFDSQKGLRAIDSEIATIHMLVRGNAREEASLAHLEDLTLKMGKAWTDLKAALDKDNNVESLKMLLYTRKLERNLLGSLDAFIDEQLALEKSEVASEAINRKRVETALWIGIIFNIVVAVSLAVFFNRSTSRRLNILMDNTVRLAAGKPLNLPLTGDDEIAHLDHTFSTMARALAQAARQDRAIVDKATDVICSIDEKGALTRVSPAAEKLWGYQPVDLIGRKYITLIAQSDQAFTLAAMQEIREGRREQPVENRVVCKDGGTMDMLWSAQWSEEDKTTFCVAHDITARKQAEKILREAEARVRLIVESVPVGLLIIDDKGSVEFANPTASVLCGLSRPDLVGLHVAQLFGNKNAAKFLLDLMRETRDGAWELQLKATLDKILPVEVSLTKFQGAGGERYLLMLVDMTERNEIERMRQEFLSMVSHDLRSPLTSVQSFLDLLGSGLLGELNEKGGKKLAAADRNVAHLITMIRDLLDVERARSGKLLIFPEEISLATLIERSLDAVRIQAEGMSINLVSDVVETSLTVDGDRLSQVLINLLTNAIKFSPARSSIHITSRVLNNWIELRVTDQGRGIAPAHQKQIFDRFQQVKASDLGYKGGTGLGLAICKAIVEQHGGSIGVDSTEGQGSSFWFRVPMHVVANS